MPYLLSTLLRDPYDAVARVAQRTTRLDPRYADLNLDFTRPYQERSAPVRETVLADWRERGLESRPEQRAALLLMPDGRLDEEAVAGLLGQRDDRDVILSE